MRSVEGEQIMRVEWEPGLTILQPVHGSYNDCNLFAAYLGQKSTYEHSAARF